MAIVTLTPPQRNIKTHPWYQRRYNYKLPPDAMSKNYFYKMDDRVPLPALKQTVIDYVKAVGGCMWDPLTTSALYLDRYAAYNTGKPTTDGNTVGFVTDLTAELGEEILPDPTFAEGIDGWVAASSGGTPPTLSYSNGRLRITASSDGVGQRAEYSLTGRTIGEFYSFLANIHSMSSSFLCRITTSGVPAQDDSSAAGVRRIVYATTTANPIIRITFPINPGVGEWVEVDLTSYKQFPGCHLVADSDANKPSWGAATALVFASTDNMVTAIPAAKSGWYQGITIFNNAASSADAPIFSANGAIESTLRRSGSTSTIDTSAIAGNFLYPENAIAVNGVATATYPNGALAVFTATRGSGATASEIGRFYGTPFNSRYITGYLGLAMFLPEPPIDYYKTMLDDAFLQYVSGTWDYADYDDPLAL